MTRLTDPFLQAVTSKGKLRVEHFDDKTPGLSIRVSKDGRKSWRFSYTSPRGSGRARIGLGTYPATSLKVARDRAWEALGVVEAGTDPRDVAAIKPVDKTIAELVDDRIRLEVRADASNYLKSCMEIERCYDKDVIPVVGSVPVKDFRISHLNRVIDPIIARGAPAQANRTYEHMRALFSFAVQRGEVDYSPIARAKAPAAEKTKDRFLTPGEIRTLWNIWSAPPSIICRAGNIPRICKLILATGQRPGEVAGIERSEINLADRLWIIPASRSKNGHAHTVPLNNLAMPLIADWMRRTNSQFLFPNEEGDGSTPNYTIATTVARALEPIGDLPFGRWNVAKFTPHDLRRTVATQMSIEGNGLEIPELYISHVLNHRSVTKSSITSRVYNQNTYLTEKRSALDKWGAFLAKLVGVEIEQQEAA